MLASDLQKPYLLVGKHVKFDDDVWSCNNVPFVNFFWVHADYMGYHNIASVNQLEYWFCLYYSLYFYNNGLKTLYQSKVHENFSYFYETFRIC